MGEPWFGAKDYGIGISPKTTAGWVSVAAYVAAMIATPRVVRGFAAPQWIIWLVFAALTVAFLLLVRIKSNSEPWRWRWGGR